MISLARLTTHNGHKPLSTINLSIINESLPTHHKQSYPACTFFSTPNSQRKREASFAGLAGEAKRKQLQPRWIPHAVAPKPPKNIPCIPWFPWLLSPHTQATLHFSRLTSHFSNQSSPYALLTSILPEKMVLRTRPSKPRLESQWALP